MHCCTRQFRHLHLGLVCLLVGLVGCAHPPKSALGRRDLRSARGLERILVTMDAAVDASEAQLLARTAHQATRELAWEYRAVWPPGLHNRLVNAGMRERGLCFHWADDLAAKLQSLPLRTLEFHMATAHTDTHREHNCVVVSAPGRSLDEGVVLDGWRLGGRLYWTRVARDYFPWRPLDASPASENFAAEALGLQHATVD